MRYHVTIGSRSFEVSIDGSSVTVDGESVQVELAQLGATPLRRLSVDGASHRLVAQSGNGRGVWNIHLDGRHLIAEVVDERTKAIRALTARTAQPGGPKPVRAPMPGMVVRVEVQTGQQVQAGQGVVIMEAMKMENELKAEVAGTVTRVMVSEGTAVEKGTVLVEFATHE